MSTLSLFAELQSKPEHREDALQALRELVPATLAEPGCDIFSIHINREDPNRFHLFEVFADDNALKYHYDQSYTQDVFTACEVWLVRPASAIKMTPEEI